MKKYLCSGLNRSKRRIVMRINLAIFFICFFILQVSAAVNAQQITLNVQNAPLKVVLEQIKAQSGYKLFYDSKMLEKAIPVTIKASNIELKEALNRCMYKQPVTYELLNKTILIKAKPVSIGEKIISFLKAVKITGVVKDEQNKPLAGVTIRIKGTNTGTVTDKNGAYSIEANQGQVLLISFLGFEVQEISVGDNAEINIVLKQAVEQMNEVNIVSTGFQQLPKERATGSFAIVSQQQLERQVTPDIISRMEGITSGLVFNTNYLGNRQIRVRGQNTIYANAEPLIVVDNFPYEGSIDNINPNDIESITTLKDAAAASIWGVRAGNGVIVITTKKGKQNELLKIGFTSNVSIGEKPDIYYSRNFLNSSDFIDVEQKLFTTGYYTQYENAVNKAPLSPVVELLIRKRDNPSQAAAIDQQINAYRSNDVRDELQEYFYKRSLNQQYAVNFTGGTNNVTYFLSAGADLNKGNVASQSYNRYSVNAQGVYKPIKNLEINTGLTYMNSRSEQDNILSQLPSNIDPYTQLADVNGNALQIVNNYRLGYVNAAAGNGFLDWRFFPLDEIGRNLTRTNTTENRLNLALKYTFLKGLSGEVRYQYQEQLIKTNTLATADSYFARNLVNQYSTVNTSGVATANNIPKGGILSFGDNKVVAQNFRAQLNYSREFKDHGINAIAGYEVREVAGDILNGRFYGYDPEITTISKFNGNTAYPLQPNGTGTIPSTDAVSNTVNRFISYFANAAYSYKERYTLSGSARLDASNFFGVYTNQREVPLWSAGAMWDASKEAFYHVGWLPKLKIRATYGFNGNLDKSLSAYTTSQYMGAAAVTGATYAWVINPPNPELRWEKTNQLNLGLDFTLKNNIVSGSVEYFRKRGTDMIGDAEFAPSTGITKFRGNYANISGKGWEATLNINPLKGQLRWNSMFLFNYATDKVTRYEVVSTNASLVLYGGGFSAGIYPKEGYPVYGLYSYKWAGLNPTTGDPQGYVNGVLSTNYSSLNNPSNFDDLVYSGPAKPVYSGGWQNTFSFHNITLSFTINYKLGYYFRPQSIYYGALFEQGTGYADYRLRWQRPGDESTTHVPSMPSGVNAARDQFYNNSAVLVQWGDHIRLQDINLSYTFSQKLLSKLPFRQFTVFGYARNLGILWRKNNLDLDPDYYMVNAGMPASIYYSLGLRANF